MQPLEDVQREFFNALQFPLRGRSRRSTELPPSDEDHSQEFLDTAGRLMKETSNLSSAERLELYHRQYWFRVLDSVAEDFPVVQKMAGDEKFWLLMEAYLLACPSGSFTLRHLGRSMSKFISTWDGFDEVEQRWFASIAEIEYANMEVFEAAEREPLSPELIATEVLEIQPHVRLIAMPVPADECSGWDSFSPSEDAPTFVAVWRGPKGSSLRARLDPVEFELLTRMKAGGQLHELFAEPFDPEPSEEQVRHWFGTWQSRDWITAKGSEVIELSPTPDDDWTGVDKMGSQARAMED